MSVSSRKIAFCLLLASVFALSSPSSQALPLQGQVGLVPGLNLIGLPVDTVVVPDLAHLLPLLGDATTIARVLRLHPVTGQFEACAFDATGLPTGTGCDAPVLPGEGWLVEALASGSLSYHVDLACPTYHLQRGVNLVALPCAAAGLTAYTLLSLLGSGTTIASVQTFDTTTGQWLSAAYHHGMPAGIDFPIVPGKAYVVGTHLATTLAPPVAQAGPDQIVLRPPFQTVSLDGRSSTAPDTLDASLHLHWTLLGPGGSQAALDDPQSAQPLFTPDLPGLYIVTLTVADGLGQSTDSLQVIAIDPDSPDSDGDGLPDAAEVALGTQVQQPDSDGDGLMDGAEVHTYRTDPLRADTDGDSVSDGHEITAGSHPLDPQSTPETVALQVTPVTVDFGQVFVGSSAYRSLTLANNGNGTLQVQSITASAPMFQVFPPTHFDIGGQEVPRPVVLGFSPSAAGPATGVVTVTSNASGQPPVQIQVSGMGTVPGPGQVPALTATPALLNYGVVMEGQSGLNEVLIQNDGTAPLTILAASTSQAAFSVVSNVMHPLPFTLAPGARGLVQVRLTPPAGSAGTTLTGMLQLNSNDPAAPIVSVGLMGHVAAPTRLDTLPLLSARVRINPFDQITAASCASVGGEAIFGTPTTSAGSFVVTLSDQAGTTVSSAPHAVPQDGGLAFFSSINACGLRDGTIMMRVTVTQAGQELQPAFTGTPAVKNTSPLAPPVVRTPVGAPFFTTQDRVEVCGTAQPQTLIQVEGGAHTVATTLDAASTEFCLEVPLRPNTQNILIVAAVDNDPAATLPRNVAAAPPFEVVQLNLQELVLAEVHSRPLSVTEITTLVAQGVINLDDPNNFNVSLFTIVLTIGSAAPPVVVSQIGVWPSKQPQDQGAVAFGGGGGWSGSSGGGGGGGGGQVFGIPLGGGGGIGGGGSSGGSNATVIMVHTPTGNIPGLIFIDGRIKTLKEFFQVTLLLQNTSPTFSLTDVGADIRVPAGLSPVRAGIGTDPATITPGSAVAHVDLGSITPGMTAAGQFVIRGDALGTHSVMVDFAGLVTGPGLSQAVPFDGSVETDVQVFGPPQLEVVVTHPSDPHGPDVQRDAVYTLTVSITNRSPVPALYTSLELMLGPTSILLDSQGQPLANNRDSRSFGHVQPGQTVSAAFLVQSRLQGEILVCQAVASDNIMLTVQTGQSGDPCLVSNTIPAPVQAPPGPLAPRLLTINPLNGQAGVSPSTAVLAVLTPQTACLEGDTFSDVVTAPIDPNDLSQGLQVVSARLQRAGTFYLEELDALGNPLRRVPTDLTVSHNTNPDTTSVLLRPGLSQPPTQVFLRPNTTYRATLVGESTRLPGAQAICHASSGVLLPTTYTWTFATNQDCRSLTPPLVTLLAPANGTALQPLNQSVVLGFSNRMDPGTVRLDAAQPLHSSVVVLAGAQEVAGDLIGGTVVPGSFTFTHQFRTATFTPAGPLPAETDIFIRLTGALRDTCGRALSTPAGGVQLFRFRTQPSPATPPAAPLLEPLPTLTSQASIAVSGRAAPATTVTISGGLAPVTLPVSGASGFFSTQVALRPNASNVLQVHVTDASGQASPRVTRDRQGAPLVVFQDATAPSVVSVSIPNGATNVPQHAVLGVQLSEDLDPGSVNSLNVVLDGSPGPGTLQLNGNRGFTLTPQSLLAFGQSYTLRLRAGGLRDLAGNSLAAPLTSTFTVRPNAPPVAAAGADQSVSIGTTVTLDGQGSSDPDGQPLTYQWSLTSQPAGSRAVVVNPGAARPSFLADVPGQYVVQLVVSDGIGQSAPDTVTVTAIGTLTLTLLRTPGIPLGQTGLLRVSFTAPGASGVTVTVTSTNPAALSVQSPGTTSVSGSTPGQVTLRALQAGVTTVQATAPNFAPAALQVLSIDTNNDADVDGLTMAQEAQLGTNPALYDTDGDGFSDGIEVAEGSNPLNPNSLPASLSMGVPVLVFNHAAPGVENGVADGQVFSVRNEAAPGLESGDVSQLFSVQNEAGPGLESGQATQFFSVCQPGGAVVCQ
ncbi:MAG: Ig-like domain-containing protein [Candidatus Tectimicrobiota bacterium]